MYNAVTLVSGGLLSLAEQKPAMSGRMITNNMVVTLTCDRVITEGPLACAVKVWTWYEIFSKSYENYYK